VKVLVLNAGSSSLKYQVIDTALDQRVTAGSLEDIGTREVPNHERALEVVMGELGSTEQIDAVGHRVVHGGERFVEPTLVTDEVESHIDALCVLAPLHNPANLQGIRAARRTLSGVPHVAVFDTAFHQSMPPEASTVALPEDLAQRYGIRKYGFHGTSHRYVSRVASEMLGGDVEHHRVITAHLGNGSSIAAVKGGRCIDTSMGFTPLSGLIMGSRAGDIDPAVVTHLLTEASMSVEDVTDMLNRRSGLQALAGTNDFRVITQRAEQGDSAARLALSAWAWRVRHYIGGYAALLGGVDALVFTGGIGENSSTGRALATQGLEFAGVVVDDYLNNTARDSARVISPAGSAAAVLVIPTNEEWEIATQVSTVVSRAR